MQGSINVTHSGTFMLEVDSATGKQKLRLDNVLLIESMSFNILSLQKLRTADFFYDFREIPGKVVLKKELPNGDLQQVALLTKTTARRMTLDCLSLPPWLRVDKPKPSATRSPWTCFTVDLAIADKQPSIDS